MSTWVSVDLCRWSVQVVSVGLHGGMQRGYMEGMHILGLMPIMGSWYCQNIEGASLFFHRYHWLPLATFDLVGDNRQLGNLGHMLRFYAHYGWVIV